MKRYQDRLLHSLPNLSVRKAPPELGAALRVLASHEQQRRASRQSLAVRARLFRERFRMFCNDVVWPLALPFAGGVGSAVVLFSMLVPAYPLRAPSLSDVLNPDVPTMLTTSVEVKGTSPFVTSSDELVVDVWVDGRGRMFDYAIVAGAGVLANSQIRRRLENMLLFTQFTPATEFGLPTSAKVRLRFGSSRVDVRG